MALYDYTGQLGSGAVFNGTVEAERPEQAEAMLSEMGVCVTSLRATKRTAFVTPLSLDEFTFFNEQLSALTKASMPLEEGLRQLAADVGSRKLKRLLLALADDLAGGMPLEEALQRQRGRFPEHYAQVVRAGLQTGDLGGTLYGLTTHLRLKSSLRRSLIELAVYPLVVLTLTFFVSSFIMRHVVPHLCDIVREAFGRPFFQSMVLPGLVVKMAAAWPAVERGIGAALLAIVVVCVVASLPGCRAFREWLLRHIPGVAQVYWSSVVARFAHTTALAAFSGRPLPDLIVSGGESSGSPRLIGCTRRVAERLNGGDSLQAAAANEKDIPSLWTCAVMVAAPRGDLPAVLAELARTYELRAQHWVNALRAVLGPLLLLVVAVAIGGVIMVALSTINVVLQSLMRSVYF